MLISDKKSIQEILDEFQGMFPHLRIEFYKKHHNPGEGSPAKEQYGHHKTLAQIRTIHNKGDITISEDMTVDELETSFYEKFGLNAQVFRRSGGLWLQTISTDSWTLKRQNDRGGRMIPAE